MVTVAFSPRAPPIYLSRPVHFYSRFYLVPTGNEIKYDRCLRRVGYRVYYSTTFLAPTRFLFSLESFVPGGKNVTDRQVGAFDLANSSISKEFGGISAKSWESRLVRG